MHKLRVPYVYSSKFNVVELLRKRGRKYKGR